MDRDLIMVRAGIMAIAKTLLAVAEGTCSKTESNPTRIAVADFLRQTAAEAINTPDDELQPVLVAARAIADRYSRDNQ